MLLPGCIVFKRISALNQTQPTKYVLAFESEEVEKIFCSSDEERVKVAQKKILI